MSSPYANASSDPGRFVFLSHNSLDKAEVEGLAYALADRGVRPWLDKWHLIPGRPWQTEIEAALRDAMAVVLCVGRHGLGRVQRPEMLVAQDQAWSDAGRPLIPVFLPAAPAAPDLPDFLRQLTWIDFRAGIDAPGLERLIAALAGRVPGAGPRRPEGPCPYQGLAAFDEEDAERFFGREAEVASLVAKLRRGDRLLTLVGASGAGKSSLLLAGLLPAVRTGEVDGTYDWRVARLRPGPRPVHQLAVRLTHQGGGTPEDLAALKRTLRGSHEGLSDQADLLLASSARARMLVVVDQFEELFTQVEDGAERRAFVAALLHAAAVAGGRVTVVLTLRADFLGRALDHSRELAAAIKASQELVLPMAPEALRQAIERPAWQAGLDFEDGLSDTLVHEVEGQPGDLPLLQFALATLWRERHGRRLTWAAYRRIGELRGAIAGRAGAFLAELEGEQAAALRRISSAWCISARAPPTPAGGRRGRRSRASRWG